MATYRKVPARIVTIDYVGIKTARSEEYRKRAETELTKLEGGYGLRIGLSDGEFTALLPTEDKAVLESMGLESRGNVVVRVDRQGEPFEKVEVGLQ